MNPKLYFIIGAPQSGKTTFGNELAKCIGGQCADTSAEILMQYALLTGYALTGEDKNDHRNELAQIGNLICSRDPARPVELIINISAPGPLVICGVRRKLEYHAALRLAARRGYRPVTVLINRPLGITSDNFDLHDIDADFEVENCSTLEYLKRLAPGIAIAAAL